MSLSTHVATILSSKLQQTRRLWYRNYPPLSTPPVHYGFHLRLVRSCHLKEPQPHLSRIKLSETLWYRSYQLLSTIHLIRGSTGVLATLRYRSLILQNSNICVLRELSSYKLLSSTLGTTAHPSRQQRYASCGIDLRNRSYHLL